MNADISASHLPFILSNFNASSIDMKYFFTLFFLFSAFASPAQKAFTFHPSPNVEIEGAILENPFAGGINAAQFQTMDVSGDGKEELVVWDRNTRNLLVFENNGENYLHRPDLVFSFPADVSGYLILADFDQNGRKDLFTSSPLGIKAYKNTAPANSPPVWQVSQEFLRLESGTNLQANNLDIPVIMDIDGDGDLDIVTFNFAAGDYLEYFRNTSMERKGNPDIDGFVRDAIRWGKFEFCGCDQFAFGVTCAGNPIQEAPGLEEYRIQHIGGHSLLLHDFTGNGVRDMLLGQDECNTLYFLPNQGTNENPLFTSFSKELPGLGPLPEFPVFHVGSLIKGNLIISLNASNRSEEHNIDFGQSIVEFRAEGTGWSADRQPFLQNQMVDLGENARPFFRGNDRDGELIVTSNRIINGITTGSAARFTFGPEGFRLAEEDYAGLSSLAMTDLQVQEINNMSFYSGVQIENFTPIRRLFWNQGGLNITQRQQLQLPEVNLRGNDHLEFFTSEGRIMLLLARQTGELLKYSVEPGTTPLFTLLERNYLGFRDNPATRNLTVHVDGDDLYAIDQRGILSMVENFLTNPELHEQLIRTGNQDVASRFGRNTWVSHIPRLFGGNPDLVLGTGAGGLVYLTAAESTPADPHAPIMVKTYPNPTADRVSIVSTMDASAQLYNTMGQKIMGSFLLEANRPFEINLAPYARGIYFLWITTPDGSRVSKKLIKF
jgi:hypothetical protein